MSICCTLHAIHPDQLAQLRADPPLVWRLLEPDDKQAYLAARRPARRVPLLQRLFGRAPAPAAPPPVVPDVPVLGPGVLELDKSWDGLRHCIGRCAPDAPDLFAGDGPIGLIDVGYGPALAVEPSTLARYAAALQDIEEPGLLHQLQVSDFEDVYLAAVWRQRDADAQAYLLENFQALLDFTRQGAAQGLAAVLCYS